MKTLVIVTLLVASAGIAGAGDPIIGTEVQLEGEDVFEREDVSGVVAVGKLLIFGADELASVQLLDEKDDGAKYAARKAVSISDDEIIRLANGGDAELDLEGAAADGRTIYLIGSHSRKRFKVIPGEPEKRTVAENRERLESTTVERNRNYLFRMKLGNDGTIDKDSVARVSLRDFIDQHPILGAFADIPSKENGIDIEALAFKGKNLYVGCRGPVLRQNWVPVLRLKFDKAASAKVRYVPLGGLGIRGMDTVEDGFLVLAGPVGDGPGPYRIYFWDGDDCIPGKGAAKSKLESLATIEPLTPEGKAEGITVIGQDGNHWQVLVVFDGAKEKILGKYEIPKTPND